MVVFYGVSTFVVWLIPNTFHTYIIVVNYGRGWLEGSLFKSYYTEVYGEDATIFPVLLHFTLDTYLIMLRVKQGSINTIFESLVWFDLTLNPGLLANTLTTRPMRFYGILTLVGYLPPNVIHTCTFSIYTIIERITSR